MFDYLQTMPDHYVAGAFILAFLAAYMVWAFLDDLRSSRRRRRGNQQTAPLMVLLVVAPLFWVTLFGGLVFLVTREPWF